MASALVSQRKQLKQTTIIHPGPHRGLCGLPPTQVLFFPYIYNALAIGEKAKGNDIMFF